MIRKSSLLENAPLTVFLARYGGGDALKTAQLLVATDVPENALDTARIAALRNRVFESSRAAWSDWSREPRGERVAELPGQFPSSPDRLSWETHFVVTSPLRSPDGISNLFAQAWLFDSELSSEASPLGRSRWPLVGVFGAVGFHDPPRHDVAFAPLEAVGPADQHVHLVIEQIDLDGFPFESRGWHFGSDSARVIPVESVALPRGWVACVDLERRRCLLAFLVIAQDPRKKPTVVADPRAILNSLGISDPTFR